MLDTLTLSESLGDYLETIYWLVERDQFARVKDIAERMAVQMSSVTGALKALAERGLVEHDPYSPVRLTDRGREAAKEIVRRHEVLTAFFSRVLGLPRKEAEENACHMEHAIQPLALERLVKFLEFVERCPRTGPRWVAGLDDFCESRPELEECESCLRQALTGLKTRIERERQADERAR